MEISKNATPVCFLPWCMAARKLFSRCDNTLSFIATPGVTSSVMPRFTNFLVALGSSNCSQMATRLPARTNLGRYVSSAWWGKPANSTCCAEPLARRVSVIPKISDAVMASSLKVS